MRPRSLQLRARSSQAYFSQDSSKVPRVYAPQSDIDKKKGAERRRCQLLEEVGVSDGI